MKPAILREVFSAGGVIYRTSGEGGVEIVMVRLSGKDFWTFPKGLIEEGEDAPGTALREVREEAGLDCRIEQHLCDVVYWYHDREENSKYRKKVHYYLMSPVSGSTDGHDHEVDEARWLPSGKAIGLVKYRNDRHVIEKALEAIGEKAANGHG